MADQKYDPYVSGPRKKKKQDGSAPAGDLIVNTPAGPQANPRDAIPGQMSKDLIQGVDKKLKKVLDMMR